MNTVRCKFECVSVEKRKGWGSYPFLYAAKFTVVVSGSDENKTFFAATPSGHIEISTVKEDHFVVGKLYYVDFTPTEE